MRASTFPFAGFSVGKVFPEAASTARPSMKAFVGKRSFDTASWMAFVSSVSDMETSRK